jgi:N-acetyl sugar amidotransferase
MIRFCIKCLQPDTRPNIKFDNDGVCPPCNYAEVMKEVDWTERRSHLDEIIGFGKNNSHSGYDCIIGVSGGKDSTRQAVFVKEELNMNPLLVSLNYPPEQMTDRGAHNISNMISLGFDTITIGPAPRTWKKLMREGFIKYGNWARSTELSLFSSVPRLAVAYQIPLIFWGENPALTLGEQCNNSDGYDGGNMKNGNTLGGGKFDWLLENGLTPADILQYKYPADDEMSRAGLRIVYVGYFMDQWTKLDNGNFAATHGLRIRNENPSQMGDILGVDSLDEDWVILNQMIKYLKFGFGKVTEIVSEEIRYRNMDRSTAIELVKRYDGTCSDSNIESFCKFIDITVADFWRIVDGFVNKDLFQKDVSGKWIRKFKVQ